MIHTKLFKSAYLVFMFADLKVRKYFILMNLFFACTIPDVISVPLFSSLVGPKIYLPHTTVKSHLNEISFIKNIEILSYNIIFKFICIDRPFCDQSIKINSTSKFEFKILYRNPSAPFFALDTDTLHSVHTRFVFL